MSELAEVVDDVISPPETETSATGDANDYSRFDTVNDDTISSDDEEVPSDGKIPLDEAVFRSNLLKDEGNASFKRGDFSDALSRYGDGIKLLEVHKETADAKTVLVSLFGNTAMVQLKLEDFSSAAASASQVLGIESDNVKALFRRAVAYHNIGKLDDAKTDLTRTLELDSGNSAAVKELAEVNKKLKEAKLKEKAAFSSMFKKSMYGDREQERAEKLRKEDEEKQRMQDEWTQSKLDRRAKGLEEQTFDDWKKERDEAEKKQKEEDEKKRSSSGSSSSSSGKGSSSKPKKASSGKSSSNGEDGGGDDSKSAKEGEEEEEYDEEEAKIIAETKAKGYCYFRKEQSSEVKALIGDITPKTIDASVIVPGAAADRVTIPTSTSERTTSTVTSEKVEVSSWNHAGTWEERDLTVSSKDRLKALCSSLDHVLPFDFGDPVALTAAIDAMKTTVGGGDGSGSSGGGGDAAQSMYDNINASMSTVRAQITGTKSLEGEAQIVLARGKKRHIYDFNMTLDFEVSVEPAQLPGEEELGQDTNEGTSGKSSNKGGAAGKKYKGTLQFLEISPNCTIEPVVKFKKEIPANIEKRVRLAADGLKSKVCDGLRVFESEFKDL